MLSLVALTLIASVQTANADALDCPWDSPGAPKIGFEKKPNNAILTLGEKKWKAGSLYLPKNYNSLYQQFSMCLPGFKRAEEVSTSNSSRSIGNLEGIADHQSTRAKIRDNEKKDAQQAWDRCHGKWGSKTEPALDDMPLLSTRFTSAKKRLGYCRQYVEKMKAQEFFDRRDWSIFTKSDWVMLYRKRKVKIDTSASQLDQYNQASYGFLQLKLPQLGGAKNVGNLAEAEAYIEQINTNVVKWKDDQKAGTAKCTEVYQQIEEKRLEWKLCADGLKSNSTLRKLLSLDPKSGIPLLKDKVKACSDKTGITSLQQSVAYEKGKPWHGVNCNVCGSNDFPVSWPLSGAKDGRVQPCGPYWCKSSYYCR